MVRGDYQVQDVEASKQAGRDNSYRTCVLTMFIFLTLCIILLVITWMTWKPTSNKDSYPSHQKFDGRHDGTYHHGERYGVKRSTPYMDSTTTTTTAATTTHHSTEGTKQIKTTSTTLTTSGKAVTQLEENTRVITTESILNNTKHITTNSHKTTYSTTKIPYIFDTTTAQTNVATNTITTAAATMTTNTSTAVPKMSTTEVTQSEEYVTMATRTESSPATTITSINQTIKMSEQSNTTTSEEADVSPRKTTTTTTRTNTPVAVKLVTTEMTELEEHLASTRTGSSIAATTVISTQQTTEISEQPNTTASNAKVTVASLSTTTLTTPTSIATNTTGTITTAAVAAEIATTEMTQLEDYMTSTRTESSSERTVTSKEQTVTKSEQSNTTSDASSAIYPSHTTAIVSATISTPISTTVTTLPVVEIPTSEMTQQKENVTTLLTSTESSLAATTATVTEKVYIISKQPNTTIADANATIISSNTATSTVNTIADIEIATTEMTQSEEYLTMIESSPAVTQVTSTVQNISESEQSNITNSNANITVVSSNATTSATVVTSTNSITPTTEIATTAATEDLTTADLTTETRTESSPLSRIVTSAEETTNESEQPDTTLSNINLTPNTTTIITTVSTTPTTTDELLLVGYDETSTSTVVFNHHEKKVKVTESTTAAPVTEEENYCTSSACKVVASGMLSLMNHSADACENFYEFACGGLRDNRYLLQNDPEQEVWLRISDAMKLNTLNNSEAFQKFHSFYDQCLRFDSTVSKTSRLSEVGKVLDNIGKMYNDTEWINGNLNLNLTSLLVKLFQLNSAPLFDVLLDVDGHNSSRFLLKLTAPTHQSKFQSDPLFVTQCRTRIISEGQKKSNLYDIYKRKYVTCTRDYADYMNTTVKALKELEMFKDLEPYYQAKRMSDIRFLIEFEILRHLEELPGAGEMRRIILSKEYTLFSVYDIQEKYPQVDWKTLLSALVGKTITSETTVQLYFENYFNNLFDGFTEYFAKGNINKMIMHNSLLAMLAHNLYVDLVLTQSPCSREEYCLKVASGLMEDVSSALYLSTFRREQLNDMELELLTLFTQLKSTLEEQFRDTEWLDDSSRSYLISKLHEMTPVADGGKVFLSDSDILNERLSKVNVNSSDNYLQNALQLVQWYRNGMYSLYGDQPNRTEAIWTHFLLPYDIQPLAVYELNIVVIPYGLIQSPHSTSQLPSYIFKARVGNDLARQLIHHFDIVGIEYGSGKKDMNLLSEYSRSKYNLVKECEEMAYSFDKSWTNHKHQIFDYKVDEHQTLNQRFADNSALRLSYKTFSRNAEQEPLLPWLDMNHERLYYLLVAQEFCTKRDMIDYTIQLFESDLMPPFLRVDNLAQNSESFSSAFKCVPGSLMNPQFRCNPFPEIKESDYGSTEDELLPN